MHFFSSNYSDRSRVIPDNDFGRIPKGKAEQERWNEEKVSTNTIIHINPEGRGNGGPHSDHVESSLLQEAIADKNVRIPDTHEKVDDKDLLFPNVSSSFSSESGQAQKRFPFSFPLSHSFSGFFHSGGMPPPIGSFPSVPYYGLGNTLTIFIGAKKDARSPSLHNLEGGPVISIDLLRMRSKGYRALPHIDTSTSFSSSNFIYQIDRSLQQTVHQHGTVWWLGTVPIDKDSSFTFYDYFSNPSVRGSERDPISTTKKKYAKHEGNGPTEAMIASENLTPLSSSLKHPMDSKWGQSTLRTDQLTRAMFHAFQQMSFLRVAANAIHSFHTSPHAEKVSMGSEINKQSAGCNKHQWENGCETTCSSKKTAPATSNTMESIKLSTFSSSSPPPLAVEPSNSFTCMTPHTTYYCVRGHPRWKDVTAMLGIENGRLLLFISASSRFTQQHLTNAAVTAGVRRDLLVWDCGALLLMEPTTRCRRSSRGNAYPEKRDEVPPASHPTAQSEEKESHAVLVMWNVLSFLPLPSTPELLSFDISDSSKKRKNESHSRGLTREERVGVAKKLLTTQNDAINIREEKQRDDLAAKNMQINPTGLLMKYYPTRITSCEVILLASFALPEAQCITPQLRLVEIQPMVSSVCSVSTQFSRKEEPSPFSIGTPPRKDEGHLSLHRDIGEKREREQSQTIPSASLKPRTHADGVTGYRYVWKLVGPVRIVHPYLLTHVVHTLVQRCEVGSFDLHYGCDDRLSAHPTTSPGRGILGGVGGGSMENSRYGARDAPRYGNLGGGLGFIQYIGGVTQTLDTSLAAPRGSSTASSWHCCSRLSYGSWLSLKEREFLGTSEVLINSAGEESVEDYLEAEFTLTRIVFKNISVSRPLSQKQEINGSFSSNRSDTFYLPPFFLDLVRKWSGWDEIPLPPQRYKTTQYSMYHLGNSNYNNSTAGKEDNAGEDKWNCTTAEKIMLIQWGAQLYGGSASPQFIHSFFFPHRWPPGFQLWKKVTRVIDTPNEHTL